MSATGTQTKQKWISIVGARPQFVKLAPVCRAIEAHNAAGKSPQIEHLILHTGQHYDREVAELLFVQMEIPEPDFNLAVGSGPHGLQMARMMERMEPILVEQKPDWVIVYGDTNSTLAGAILAARLQQKLAHVEAGCRSHDMAMPEEQTRICADHLSDLMLVASQGAVELLRREGIGASDDPRKRRVVNVGDVMFDALLQNLKLADTYAEKTLGEFDLRSKEFYLLTLHRAENTNEPQRLRDILDAAGALDFPVLFPVHPRTKHVLADAGIDLPANIRASAPLGYLEMLAMEKHARLILTDSGGVQKEAFYMRVPCVTLRDRTEWPETVEAGANCIAGFSAKAIRDAVAAQLSRAWKDAKPYGDGTAAAKIVSEIAAYAREQALHSAAKGVQA